MVTVTLTDDEATALIDAVDSAPTVRWGRLVSNAVAKLSLAATAPYMASPLKAQFDERALDHAQGKAQHWEHKHDNLVRSLENSRWETHRAIRERDQAEKRADEADLDHRTSAARADRYREAFEECVLTHHGNFHTGSFALCDRCQTTIRETAR